MAKNLNSKRVPAIVMTLESQRFTSFRYMAVIFGTGSAGAVGAVCTRRLYKAVGTPRLVHMVLLLVCTLIFGGMTGAVVFNERGFFLGLTGQVLHGLLSIVCFTLVGVAFWRFGWKIGMIDLLLLFIAANVAFSFCGHLTKD